MLFVWRRKLGLRDYHRPESGREAHNTEPVENKGIHGILSFGCYYCLKISVRELSDKIFDDFDFGSDICIVISDGCPTTLSSVGLGNTYECRHKLISAQLGKVIWILAMKFPNPTVKNPALDYIFPVHFLYITLILHLTYEPLVLD